MPWILRICLEIGHHSYSFYAKSLFMSQAHEWNCLSGFTTSFLKTD